MVRLVRRINNILLCEQIRPTVGGLTTKNHSRIYNPQSTEGQKAAAALIEVLKAAPKGFDVSGWQVSELDFAEKARQRK